MTSSTDPGTTIVDALIVGNPLAGTNGETLADINSAGSRVHVKSGRLFGVYNEDIDEDLVGSDGSSTLNIKAYHSYVDTGTQLWALLSDTVNRVIHLKPGVTYDLPPGLGTRTVGAAEKVVIGDSSRTLNPSVIRINANDKFVCSPLASFENVEFTEAWVGPGYPEYLVECDGGANFKNCAFSTTNDPTVAVLGFTVTEGNTSGIIENCLVGGVASDVDGVIINSPQNVTVRDNIFSGADTALTLSGTGDMVLVENNRFFSSASSGIAIHAATLTVERFIVRGNDIIKGSNAAPGPAIKFLGSGSYSLIDNHIQTNHVDDTAWGQNHLVLVDTYGEVVIRGNNILGQQMTGDGSGLIGILSNNSSTIIDGNIIEGGIDLDSCIEVDSEGVADSPTRVVITNNIFKTLSTANSAYIRLIDSAASANNWTKAGVIANNVFEGAGATQLWALTSTAASGIRPRGWAISGNVTKGNTQFQEDAVRNSTYTGNVNPDAYAPVDSNIPTFGNLLANNNPVT